jgi:hypothetical protein
MHATPSFRHVSEAGAVARDGSGRVDLRGHGRLPVHRGPGPAGWLGNPPAIDVFSGDVWTAGDDDTTIDAVATFQITTCTSGTGSCPATEHGDPGVRDGKGESYLGIEQLYPDGSVCRVSYAYSEESTGGQVLLSDNYDISDAQHHRPLYYHVSAPVSQLCDGSRRECWMLLQHVHGADDRAPARQQGAGQLRRRAPVLTSVAPFRPPCSPY